MIQNFLWDNFFKKDANSYDDFLKNQPLFSHLTSNELRILKRILHERSYFSGEVIFKPGFGIGLYMILRGEVHIFYGDSQKEEPVALGRLQQGDFFGELSLIQEKGYRKTLAKSAANSELLALFNPELMSLMDRHPRLGVKILIKLSEILGMRLMKAGEKLAHISSQGAV